MIQSGMNKTGISRNVYSVGQVNNYIKNMFTQDFMLNRIYIRGEVSNCKYHTSGHIYFSLKDETGTMACVMFAGQRRGLAFSMKNGDKVVVGGSVGIYERDGRYQLYAKEITLEGAGALYERFLALKQELEEMGMFAAEYKQPIPKYNKRIGIVTAPTGAAIQDIRNISYRRNPFVQLILYPALVQGEGAKESIVKGIQALDKLGLDVLIVGRGGGSIEDLWAFNEEAVARAIFNCRTPVISAVGHETDVTIADYVADLRAPTPSAAAELAVADIRELMAGMGDYRKKLTRAMENRFLLCKARAEQYQVKLNYLSPQNQIREKRQYLMDLEEKLNSGMEYQVFLKRQQLNLYIQRLKGLSPLDKLNQGFSYVTDAQGHTVRSIEQAKPGDALEIQVTDGRIRAEVQNVRPEEWRKK
ncbi:MAG: exodeoxyribonuclease VII large subunit [Lachnospiraceae bacterium]|nr:exodeoxyribonuclease VII large subunit [Lachnospiraceae bacterium]